MQLVQQALPGQPGQPGPLVLLELAVQAQTVLAVQLEPMEQLA